LGLKKIPILCLPPGAVVQIVLKIQLDVKGKTVSLSALFYHIVMTFTTQEEP
jgi:hypothetical protein